MTNDEYQIMLGQAPKVGEAMRNHGGSFVKALGECIARADGDNLQRIRKTWPEYWEKYLSMANGRTMQRTMQEYDSRLIGDLKPGDNIRQAALNIEGTSPIRRVCSTRVLSTGLVRVFYTEPDLPVFEDRHAQEQVILWV